MAWRRWAAAAATIAGMAGLAAHGAFAASMHVAPLRLDLGPQRPVASVVIGNPEQAEIAVQAEAVAWTQEGGRDVYTPTREVLINPSIFRIPAGGQQIVRVGLQVGAEGRERSYRMFVRQLPQERTGAQSPGLQTLLRIGIPIFIAPTGPGEAAESLDWQLKPAANGSYDVVIENKGTVHAQITSIVVRRENGAELVSRKLSHYVLAGKSSAISLDLSPQNAPEPGTTLRIEAVAAGDRAIAPLVLRVPNAPAAPR